MTERFTGYCSGCELRWKGSSLAHCAACHTSFSGAWLFDEHRRMGDSDDEHGYCLDPHEMSGIEQRTTGVWHRTMKISERSRKNIFEERVKAPKEYSCDLVQ